MVFPARLVAAAAVVFAVAGCTAPTMRIGNPPVYVEHDLGSNYPIRVERQETSIALPGARGAEALTAGEIERLDRLFRDYWANARGPLSITVPRAKEGESRALDRAQQIADHAMWRGLRETEVVVLVETSISEADAQIVVSYPFYVARLPTCGDWSKESSYDPTNTEFSNFGCAIQRNVGSMVADPADLVMAREYGLHDTIRSDLVVQQYRAGEVTAAKRSEAEQAAITRVGGQ